MARFDVVVRKSRRSAVAPLLRGMTHFVTLHRILSSRIQAVASPQLPALFRGLRPP